MSGPSPGRPFLVSQYSMHSTRFIRRQIIGIVLLPIVVFLQLWMLPDLLSGHMGEDMNDPLIQAQYIVDPLTSSEYIARVGVGLVGMGMSWVLLYFLLRKARKSAFDTTSFHE